MQWLILCVSICVVAAFPRLSAQAREPVIRVDNADFDAGRVSEGRKIEHRFEVTNKGSATLEIFGVQPSCGCTSTKWSRKIAPGETGTIDVEVTTAGMAALSKALSESVPIRKTITVTSNDPGSPRTVLTVSATVLPIVVTSESLVFFGTVPPEKEVSKEVLVEVAPDQPVTLTNIAATGDDFNARLEPVAGSNGKKFKVIAVLKPTAVEGWHQGTIVIKTSSRMKPEVTISLRGIVKKVGGVGKI